MQQLMRIKGTAPVQGNRWIGGMILHRPLQVRCLASKAAAAKTKRATAAEDDPQTGGGETPPPVVDAKQLEIRQQQKDALAVALAKINKQFGKGTVSQLGSKPAYDTSRIISTGTLALDDALGIGGLPLGRIIEIFGPEASGKTCKLVRKTFDFVKQSNQYIL